MYNDNESKLIYGMILITAWTECKNSCEWQYFEVQGKVTYIYSTESSEYPTKQMRERKEKKNAYIKVDGYNLAM